MASDFPASSSQQPFANPQPAPVPAASQAASPPTKQSLKSWWKGFRPPAKNHDTPGNPLAPQNTSFTAKYFVSDTFVSRVPRNRDPLFQENPMDASAASIDGLPFEEAASRTSSMRQTSNRIRRVSSQDLRDRHYRSRRSSSIVVGSGSGNGNASFRLPRHMPEAHSASARHALKKRSPTPYPPMRKRSSRHRNFAADISSESSLEAGILPSPKRKPLSHFLSLLTLTLSSLCPGKSAKQTMKAVEQPTGIFGVPLRQSISYANVAISLIDAEGKSYIYGYVPIVVAKCGVYLKEKGSCCAAICGRHRANRSTSDQCRGDFPLEWL